MATRLGKIVADFRTSLATRIAVSGTSATLQSATDDDSVSLPAGVYYFTIDGDNAQKEHIQCSLSSTAITSIQSVSRQGVLTSGCVREHRIGASVVITDFAHIKYMSDLLDGTTNLNASVPLGYDGTASVTTANQLATKAYVDGVAIAGASDASTTVKGIVEEATDAELQAGTGAGGTSARLFAGGASHNQTAAANKVPVAKSNAKLDDGWIGLTTAGDIVYSDGTDLQRLAATTARFLRMNGTTPEWGGANLDEANTFFGATDISGAEAETLSSAATSDAQSLHTHGNLSQRQHSFSTLVNVVNTTTETTILTKSISGGILGTANALLGKIFINNINFAVGATLTLRLKYGGSTVATIALVNNAGGNISSYEGKIEFDVLASGATGTQTGHIEAYVSVSAGSISNIADRNAFDLSVGTSSIDSTSAQTLLVTAQWSGASASSSVSFDHGWVEALRG